MAVRGQPRRNSIPALRGALAAPPGGRTPPPPTVLVFDQFVSPDGTAITAHAIAPTNVPGTSWSNISGTSSIVGNAVIASTFGPTSSSEFVCNPGISDGTWSADFKMVANGYAYLLFRTLASLNNWQMILSSAVGNVRFMKWVGGANTVVDTAAFVPIIGQTYNLKVIAAGPAIAGYIDGAPVLSASDAQWQTETRAGGGIGGAGFQSTITNFKVQP